MAQSSAVIFAEKTSSARSVEIAVRACSGWAPGQSPRKPIDDSADLVRVGKPPKKCSSASARNGTIKIACRRRAYADVAEANSPISVLPELVGAIASRFVELSNTPARTAFS